jgi:transposase
LTEDFKRGRKYRRTARKIYNDLAEHKEYRELLEVGRQTVTNYVSRRKKELLHNTYHTAMYGLHAPGWAQVDFGEILEVLPSGAEVTRNILVMSLPQSNAGFAQVCRNQTRECLCEALQRIFEYAGRVPTRILFDNMSGAVIQVLENGERKQTEMFMRFTMHHRFKAEFCTLTTRRKREILRTKSVRRNFLLPPPQINDTDEFNRDLLDRCARDMELRIIRKAR